MGLPVLPECRTNVFSRPGQSGPPAGMHADPCIICSEDDRLCIGRTKWTPLVSKVLFWLNSNMMGDVNFLRKIKHSLLVVKMLIFILL